MIRPTRIPAAPLAPFQTTFAGFVEERLDPLLPSEPIIRQYHRELMRYVNTVDPLFITRKVSGQNRGEIVTTCDGTRLRPSDNSPAWWWHRQMFHGVAVSGNDFAEFVENTPTHMFSVSRYETVNTAGWHAAHILDAKDGDVDWWSWTRAEATSRFVRNVHPLNLFYVPMADWPRVGREGELIGFVASTYALRWPDVWAEFTTVAGIPVLRPDTGERILRIGRDNGRRRDEEASPWNFVLGARSPKSIAEILCQHPMAEARGRKLAKDLTVERLVALGNALYNKTRRGELEEHAPDAPVHQAEIAFDRLENSMRTSEQWIAKQVHNQSRWADTIALLREGSDSGLKRASQLDLAGLVTAALRIVDGPYQTACARRRQGASLR